MARSLCELEDIVEHSTIERSRLIIRRVTGDRRLLHRIGRIAERCCHDEIFKRNTPNMKICALLDDWRLQHPLLTYTLCVTGRRRTTVGKKDDRANFFMKKVLTLSDLRGHFPTPFYARSTRPGREAAPPLGRDARGLTTRPGRDGPTPGA